MAAYQLLRPFAPVSVALLCALFPCRSAAQISGFTEPFQQVEVASDETGSIAEWLVMEGDTVKRGDVLVRLDDRVQQLQVESARHLAHSTSAVEAARQSLEKRELIARRLRELNSTGNATESELIRADLEQSISQSRFLAAQEELVTREIDLRRAELMLDRRSIRAPLDGVVSFIHRRAGEYVSPVRPELVTIVDVNKLLAVFNVPGTDLPVIEKRKELTVIMPDNSRVSGTLYSVGVQTDAESGTIQVKIAIDNTQGELRAGEQCFLELN